MVTIEDRWSLRHGRQPTAHINRGQGSKKTQRQVKGGTTYVVGNGVRVYNLYNLLPVRGSRLHYVEP